MSFVVECKNVSKKFDNVEALTDISFTIEENKIYGFLGRNGAGKTTILNILTAHLFNTGGSVSVFGEEPFENEKVLDKLCFVKDKMQFMQGFKVKQIFKMCSNFFEYWDEEFKDILVEKFELDISKRYGTLSKGMESMVSIIIGLASRAPLTIYDEAYLGLDAAARQLFYEILLQDYLDKPRTIIFSTHLIDEVSNLFEGVIIIHKGKVIIQGDKDNIMEKAFILTGSKEKLLELNNNKNVLKVEDVGNLSKVYLFQKLESEAFVRYKQEGVEIEPMSLQELFIKLTGKEKSV